MQKEVLHAPGAQAAPDRLSQIPSGLPVRRLAFGEAPSEPSFQATACTKRWRQGLAGGNGTSASPAIQVCESPLNLQLRCMMLLEGLLRC